MRPELKKKLQERAEKLHQSHKQRKLLEKAQLKKKSRINRNSLLEELKQCQLSESQSALMHSTTSMQTRGLKRFIHDENIDLSSDLQKEQSAELELGCLGPTQFQCKKPYRRRQQAIPKAATISTCDSSDIDTDACSTDTEVYEYESFNDTKVETQATNYDSELFSEFTKIPTSNETENINTRKLDIKLEESVALKKSKIRKPQPAVYVEVSRTEEVNESRSKLPIIGEEQVIMESIRYNDVVIISGETGSGKTTQLPQFLFEAGYALNGKIIGVTEPRRVAAISMSERVGYELNLPNDVSYQIRFSGNVSDSTKIKFMTDGVLMRECQKDFLLTKYSTIIIDEAHERSVFSDILIGLLSRIVGMRRKKNDPLKLIIMSATLRVSDFSDNKYLFKTSPPVLTVESRQFPVTVKFSKTTSNDYLSQAFKKVCHIHSKMPKGDILVFVTSQLEVKTLCAKLRKKLDKLKCLELYAMLPIEKQKLVFNQPNDNSRICVVSTNVAETSITIPNIKYVVDCGREKTRAYNLVTGVSKFVTIWTSKASAEQRTGRAGRIGPGLCYRLYSSAVYTNELPDFSQPKILQRPVEDILLQMKTMNIDNVVNFPFPTRPSLEALQSAERRLILLDALDDSLIKKARYNEIDKLMYASKPSKLGIAMAKFAIGARCSKMIVLSPPDLVAHTIALTSSMSVRELFFESKKANSLVGSGQLLGDFSKMLNAIIRFQQSTQKSFEQLGIRTKALNEAEQIRKQLIKEYTSNIEKELSISEVLPKLKDNQTKVLRQLLLSSYCDHVARKLPDGEMKVRSKDDPNIFVVKKVKNAYECMEVDQVVYISHDSSLRDQQPDFVIYQELFQDNKKMYMKNIAAIDPLWLPFYASKICNISEKKASYDNPKFDAEYNQVVCCRAVSFGSRNWHLGLINVPIHLVEDEDVNLWKQKAQGMPQRVRAIIDALKRDNRF